MTRRINIMYDDAFGPITALGPGEEVTFLPGGTGGIVKTAVPRRVNEACDVSSNTDVLGDVR